MVENQLSTIATWGWVAPHKLAIPLMACIIKYTCFYLLKTICNMLGSEHVLKYDSFVTSISLKTSSAGVLSKRKHHCMKPMSFLFTPAGHNSATAHQLYPGALRSTANSCPHCPRVRLVRPTTCNATNDVLILYIILLPTARDCKWHVQIGPLALFNLWESATRLQGLANWPNLDL